MAAQPSPRRVRISRLEASAVAGLAATWLTMMVEGTGELDQAVLRFLYSGNEPVVEPAARFVTLFGEWQLLVAATLIATLWLLYVRRTRSALLLLTGALVGRALIDLQKRGIGRLRPEDQEHLVQVRSLSFPSAHAANSMILFLLLALLVVPERHRRGAVFTALFGTLAVGLSRPMLGVHWPSDVIGGWAFGAFWVLTVLMLSRRIGSSHDAKGRAP